MSGDDDGADDPDDDDCDDVTDAGDAGRVVEPAPVEETAAVVAEDAAEEPAAKPKRARRAKAKPADAIADDAARIEIEAQPVPETVVEPAEPAEPAVEEAAAALDDPKPARANRDIANIASAPVIKSSTTKDESPDDEPEKPKKGGWWQRRGFF